MEQEQSNCLAGKKITGNIAAAVGTVFCITLTAYIVGVYYGFELSLVLIIFAIVLNILNTIIWVLGCIRGNSEFMLAALISWGIDLNIWLGYLFWKTIKTIPYGPDPYQDYGHAEMAIPSVTVLFVFLFVVLILIYRKMDEDIQKLFKPDWKFYGILAGWLLIALTIGQTSLFYSQRSESDYHFYGAILFFVLNTLGAISFLYGFTKESPKFVLVSLIFWVIPLCIWTGFIIYGMTQEGYHPGTSAYKYVDGKRKKGYNPIYAISMFYVVLYGTMCYFFSSMRESSGSETERFDVAYAPPPTGSKKFEA